MKFTNFKNLFLNYTNCAEFGNEITEVAKLGKTKAAK